MINKEYFSVLNQKATRDVLDNLKIVSGVWITELICGYYIEGPTDIGWASIGAVCSKLCSEE